VGLRVGLEAVEKGEFLTLLGLELRPLCRPASSQSLYRLSEAPYLNLPNEVILLFEPVRFLHCVLLPKSKSSSGVITDEGAVNTFLDPRIHFCVW
jgi:hypothetical protein